MLYPLEQQGIHYNQNEWIFVACLFAYYPQTIRTDDKRNFGHSARGLAGESNSGGTDRRFRALLDTSVADLQSPLTALIRQMKSKSITINHPKLIVDLCRWEHPDQYVQDQWARAFWGAPDQTSEDSKRESDS